MNNDTPFTTVGDEPIEARIVAWVLGEASGFEVAELERLCAERPELLVFRRRMLALHGLLIEAVQADDGWKLSPEKRKPLDEILGQEKVVSIEDAKEKRIRRAGLKAFFAIAACVVLAIVVLQLVHPIWITQTIHPPAKSVDFMPPRGSIVDHEEDVSYSYGAGGEADRSELKSKVPSREANVAKQSKPLTTPLPPEVIEGTPRSIIVSGLETPVNGPAGHSSIAASKKKSGASTLTLRENEASKDASTDPFADEKSEVVAADPFAPGAPAPSATPAPATPAPTDIAAAEPAARSPRARIIPPPAGKRVFAEGASSSFTIPEPGENFGEMSALSSLSGPGMSGGLGSSGSATGRGKGWGGKGDKNGRQSDDDSRLSDSTARPGRSDAMKLHNFSGKNTYAGGTSTAAGTLQDHVVGFTGELAENGKDSTPDKVPIFGDVPMVGKLFSDRSDKQKELQVPKITTRSVGDDFNGTINYGSPISGESGKADQAGGGQDASATVARASCPEPSSPVFKVGKKANIEITREFKYPTEYESPTLSSQTAADGKAAPVTPESPTSFMSDSKDGQSDPAKEDADVETSKVAESGKHSGEVEYELHAGYSSEYLYRGKDLGNSDSLRKAVREQEDKVDERRKLLATIVNTKGIIYKGADSYYNKSDVDGDKGASSALQEFEKLESDRMQLQSQVKSLQKYDKDQLMSYASGLDLPDNVVRNTLPQYQEAQRKLEELKIEGLGKEHPVLKAQIAQTEALKKQLDEGVVNLRATLNAQLDLADNRLKEVEKRKDEFREAAIKRGLDAQDYVDAKRDFEKDQALLQQLKLKLHSSTKAPEPEKPKIDLTKLMEEVSASEDPYSTFSLNISDASFKVAQAALVKGERPDPAGIKVEQFYNAVDYGDPSPQNGQPVAVNIEQSTHPVIPGRNLVRVALKTAAAGRSASQPLRLTLLVDQSGSMVRADRHAAMDKALASLAGLLTKNDQITVIGFARTPRLLAGGMMGDQAGKLKDLVNQAANEGGTNLELAMNLAAKKAMEYKTPGAQNRIVLFTDGAANLGDADPARLAEKVKALRQSGIAFDIAGIAADELNDDLLGELARNGNGRYYVVGKGDDQDLGKQLAGAFRPAAENVKVQVHFNPERVSRYKLIGFEKDRLKTEDFRNDAVDAAELAAEEAGVAIYQVETLPGGSGEIGEVSVRFRDTAAGQMVERTWAIPHDSKAPAIDRATPSMQLAVLSMLAAEKLKGGPLAEAIDFKQFTDSRSNVKRFYGNSGRSSEMLQVIDAIK